MPKAHRLFLDRVSGYADEASAFLKRRKQTREPFARVYDEHEVGHSFAADSDHGERLHAVARTLIEAHRADEAAADDSG